MSRDISTSSSSIVSTPLSTDTQGKRRKSGRSFSQGQKGEAFFQSSRNRETERWEIKVKELDGMGDGQMFPVSIQSGQKGGGGETISYKRRLNARKASAQTDPCRACYVGPSVRRSVCLSACLGNSSLTYYCYCYRQYGSEIRIFQPRFAFPTEKKKSICRKI